LFARIIVDSVTKKCSFNGDIIINTTFSCSSKKKNTTLSCCIQTRDDPNPPIFGFYKVEISEPNPPISVKKSLNFHFSATFQHNLFNTFLGWNTYGFHHFIYKLVRVTLIHHFIFKLVRLTLIEW